VEAVGRCIRTTMAAAIAETDGGCLLKGRTAKPAGLTALDPAA